MRAVPGRGCKRARTIFLLAVLWTGFRPLCAAESKRFEFREPHMGTMWQIVLYAPDEPTANTASRAAFDRVEQLNGIMSDYQATSELMRLCADAGGPSKQVSADLFAVLERSAELNRRTDGLFDITVGPAVKLWRRSRRTQLPPPPHQLADALTKIGGTKVELNATERRVRLTVPGMLLDLGGIAKGYAAQEALKLLASRGIDSALVAGGGDIALGNPPPDAAGWTVALAALGPDQEAPKVILSRTNISTSGDAEQWVEIDGVRYAHIVDPRTGLGLRELCAVTVTGSDGATVDGLTKALVILGPERGRSLAEGMKMQARWVKRGAATVTTAGFPAVVRD